MRVDVEAVQAEVLGDAGAVVAVDALQMRGQAGQRGAAQATVGVEEAGVQHAVARQSVVEDEPVVALLEQHPVDERVLAEAVGQRPRSGRRRPPG